MSSLEVLVSQIRSREDLVRFIDVLLRDLHENPETWENLNLTDFLMAFGAWVGDMEGYFANAGEEIPDAPSWRLVGEMLMAARVYE